MGIVKQSVSNCMRPLGIIAFSAIAVGALAVSVQAGIASPFKNILGNASDNALTKLAKPGAFFADQAVRINLPVVGSGKLLGKLAATTGLTDTLTKSINDAAGLAAEEAKPVFHAAIDKISLNDVPDIATKNDGATQYLKKSAGDELRGKIRPLVTGALGKVGAFKQLAKLGKAGGIISALGLNDEKLTDSVTDQTLKGIYGYMGNEEAALRKNPLKVGKSVIDILTK
jgi:Protein of unknown function (DUF4197)